MTDNTASRAGARAVLLLAHGTPECLDEIPEYLRNVTSGRPLPEAAIEEIRHRYSLIGSSPLTRLTMDQGSQLEKSLQVPVYVGMRNWKPYIADVVRQMRTDGIASAVVICLAPQNSRTSVGLYRRAVFAESAGAIEIDFIDGWADHPLLAQAFAERLEPEWLHASKKAGRNVPVLFTAHSVPCRTVQTQADPGPPQSGNSTAQNASRSAPGPDPYAIEAKRTAANVACLLARSGLAEGDWHFAFQSQGMSGGPWIGPTVEDSLTALSRQAHPAVVIAPIGFLCDHVEILYDIDIGFREYGAKIGLEVTRPLSLNDSPLLIQALADLARQGFSRLDSGHDARKDARNEVLSARSA